MTAIFRKKIAGFSSQKKFSEVDFSQPSFALLGLIVLQTSFFERNFSETLKMAEQLKQNPLMEQFPPLKRMISKIKSYSNGKKAGSINPGMLKISGALKEGEYISLLETQILPFLEHQRFMAFVHYSCYSEALLLVIRQLTASYQIKPAIDMFEELLRNYPDSFEAIAATGFITSLYEQLIIEAADDSSPDRSESVENDRIRNYCSRIWRIFELLIRNFGRYDIARVQISKILAIYRETGDGELFEDAINKLLKLPLSSHEQQEFQLIYGQYCLDIRNYTLAQQFLAEATAGPDNALIAQAMSLLADCLYQLKLFKKSYSVYLELIRQYPISPEAENCQQNLLLCCYELLKNLDFSDARLMYDRLIHLRYSAYLTSESLLRMAQIYSVESETTSNSSVKKRLLKTRSQYIDQLLTKYPDTLAAKRLNRLYQKKSTIFRLK